VVDGEVAVTLALRRAGQRLRCAPATGWSASTVSASATATRRRGRPQPRPRGDQRRRAGSMSAPASSWRWMPALAGRPPPLPMNADEAAEMPGHVAACPGLGRAGAVYATSAALDLAGLDEVRRGRRGVHRPAGSIAGRCRAGNLRRHGARHGSCLISAPAAAARSSPVAAAVRPAGGLRPAAALCRRQHHRTS
jgi:hypothetical protein